MGGCSIGFPDLISFICLFSTSLYSVINPALQYVSVGIEKYGIEEVRRIYHNSQFLKNLISNIEMTIFKSDLNTFIKNKTGDERAVVVDKDTTGLEVSKPAKVEEKLGKDLIEEEEGSGCSDILVFGLVLLLVIYTVYFKIKN